MRPRRAIEDVYPLTPMQQGMLFHTLFAPDSGVYFEQLVCTLHAPFDPAAFGEAWQRMVERHAILRTSFVWEGLERPLQAVHQRVRLPIEHLDWRGLCEADQRARLDAFLREDRKRGFALGEAPLMRLTLIRSTEEAYRFICAHHHMLLDGWSLSSLMRDLLACYGALRRREAPPLEPARPYRDYIEWLEQQDPAAAERFWRKALTGFTAPTSLGIGRSQLTGEPGYAEHELTLSPALTGALQAFAHDFPQIGRKQQVIFVTALKYTHQRNDAALGIAPGGELAVRSVYQAYVVAQLAVEKVLGVGPVDTQ